MANYTAADIKALREKTGAGMLDVKKALDEANGDQQKAAEIIRGKGLRASTKREGRATAEGLVAARVENGVGYMIEVTLRPTSWQSPTPSSLSARTCSRLLLLLTLPPGRAAGCILRG